MRPSPQRTWMALGLVAGLAGCSSSADGWTQGFEPPRDTALILETVASFPECEAVRAGGALLWRAGPFACSSVMLADGCAYPGADPPRVEVNVLKSVSGSAWSTALAHELCHLCGYLDEGEAVACALRVRAAATP